MLIDGEIYTPSEAVSKFLKPAGVSYAKTMRCPPRLSRSRRSEKFDSSLHSHNEFVGAASPHPVGEYRLLTFRGLNRN